MRVGSVPVVPPSSALSPRQAQIMALIATASPAARRRRQLRPARAGPLGKLAQHLLIGRGQLHGSWPWVVVTSVTGVSSVSGVTTLKLRSHSVSARQRGPRSRQ